MDNPEDAYYAQALQNYSGIRPPVRPTRENRYEDSPCHWLAQQALTFLMRFQVRLTAK